MGILGLAGYVDLGKKKFGMGEQRIIIIVVILKVKHKTMEK